MSESKTNKQETREVRKTLRTKTELTLVELVLKVYCAASELNSDFDPLLIGFTNNLLQRLCERNGWTKIESIGARPGGKLFVTATPHSKTTRRQGDGK